MSARTLIVDDEAAIRGTLTRLFERHGYTCTGAKDAAEARACLARDAFELMLCDVHMPGGSGLDLVREVTGAYPDLAVVMVTAVDDPVLASVAVEAGVYGYIVKPFTRNEVLINAANALHRARIEAESRSQRADLARTLRERTEDLWRSFRSIEIADVKMRASVEEVVRRLSLAAEVRDPTTVGHIERMSHYSELLAKEAGLEDERCTQILLASRLHDVGKIGIPDRVLRKEGKFTSADHEVMRAHSELGHRMFAGTDAELLKLAGEIALTHHERWDGSGYPGGLRGEAIPVEGRIAAITDVFDALLSKRAYKPAWPVGKVVETMREGSGALFDPELLDAFLGRLDGVMGLAEQFPN
ncbi:MAG TPA: HD domain-containing phosphohydrolase [Actinomycetota bacterium]